ncbi:MAG: glycosyltransferase family 39 protein [Patescibacteria group bacterium]|nr:glycosyltransferase family 39 protein [Patescibacteria group bacterium]
MPIEKNEISIKVKLLNFLQAQGLRLIIIIFFIVGITGIFYDYSLNTGGDETVLMAAAIKMISEHTLRPNYPTFYHLPAGAYFYLLPFILFFILLRLLGVFTSLSSLKEFGTIDYLKFLPFARFLTVLMGMISIYFLYKITQKIFNNKWVSLLAAFFLSSSLMFVQVAHLARVWIPQVMTILLAFCLIIILYQRREDKLKDYLLVGLSIGLAFGTHVVGLAVYASFFTAHYLKNASKKIKDIFILNKYFWLVNLVIIMCYFLLFYLNPYGFKNYINKQGRILPNISYLSQNNLSDDIANAGLHRDFFDKMAYYPNALLQHEPLLVLLSLLGFVILFLRERKIFYIIVSFIIVYYPVISFVGWEPRYILPVVPFMALAAGYGISALYKKINKAAVISSLVPIMIIIFAIPLIWDYRIIQPGTRLTARGWIYKNIPAGSSIINFDPALELNENQSCLADINKFASSYFTKKRAYLLSQPEEEYPGPNYYVLNYGYFNDLPKELLNKKYDYLIIGWSDKAQLEKELDQAEPFKLQNSLLKRFPESADENGRYQDWWDMPRPIYTIIHDNIKAPVIDIYKLKSE